MLVYNEGAWRYTWCRPSRWHGGGLGACRYTAFNSALRNPEAGVRGLPAGPGDSREAGPVYRPPPLRPVYVVSALGVCSSSAPSVCISFYTSLRPVYVVSALDVCSSCGSCGVCSSCARLLHRIDVQTCECRVGVWPVRFVYGAISVWRRISVSTIEQ